MDAIQFVWSNAAQHAYVRWSSSNIIEVGLLFLFVSYILQIRFSQLDSNTVQSSNHCPSVSFTLQQLTDISKSGRLSAAPVLVFVLVQMKNMTICEVFTGSIPIESGFKCKMIFFLLLPCWLFFITSDVFTCDSRKSTGVINNTKDVRVTSSVSVSHSSKPVCKIYNVVNYTCVFSFDDVPKWMLWKVFLLLLPRCNGLDKWDIRHPY